MRHLLAGDRNGWARAAIGQYRSHMHRYCPAIGYCLISYARSGGMNVIKFAYVLFWVWHLFVMRILNCLIGDFFSRIIIGINLHVQTCSKLGRFQWILSNCASNYRLLFLHITLSTRLWCQKKFQNTGNLASIIAAASVLQPSLAGRIGNIDGVSLIMRA